jgi:microsomal epoxide hydrolase
MRQPRDHRLPIADYLLRVTLLLVLGAALAHAQGPASKFFNTSDRVRIHYLEAGKGPVLVFIPGWTMPADIWENQIAHFAKNYHVIAIDPRSQGDSDKPADGNYPERRAQDYRELIVSRKLPPQVLVGWSLGVPELMAYADLFGTAEVRGLVLVDGFVTIDESLLKIFPTFLRTAQMDRSGFTERFVKSMYKKPQSDAYIQRIVAASLRTPTNSAMALQLGTLGRPDWSPTLAKLTDVPVLFVGEDALKKQAQEIAEKLPSAKIEMFPDAGHAIFVDDAEKFNRVLEQFLLSLK